MDINLRVEERLIPRSTIRTLLELISVEAALLWDDLSEVYDDAFVATAGGDRLSMLRPSPSSVLTLVELFAPDGDELSYQALTWL